MALNRVVPQQDVRCRKCKSVPDTLGHVLGQCIYTKLDRMRRHDDILHFVIRGAKKRDHPNVLVMEEPRIAQGNAVLKPDLVLKSGNRVLMVDVTVRHEDGDYLQAGHEDKMNKNTPLLDHLEKELGVSSSMEVPIVVGTRGALH